MLMNVKIISFDQGEQNILVPIHAYPVMNTDHFPRSVTFAPIPVGQNQTKTISLKCDIPVDFEFRLSYDKLHPSFTVDKMKGNLKNTKL